MKCLACGREMIHKGSHLECSNFLCDYEEEVSSRGLLLKEQRVSPFLCFCEHVHKFSFSED